MSRDEYCDFCFDDACQVLPVRNIDGRIAYICATCRKQTKLEVIEAADEKIIQGGCEMNRTLQQMSETALERRYRVLAIIHTPEAERQMAEIAAETRRRMDNKKEDTMKILKKNQMKLTVDWLQKQHACAEGVAWFAAQTETDGRRVAIKLVEEKRLDWANWLVARLLDRKGRIGRIRYAIYAAKQAIGVFETRYPDDRRPRAAIEAARAALANDTVENRNAAVWAARAAAKAAARTTGAAARAAGAAAWAAWAGTEGATEGAWVVTAVAEAARDTLDTTIKTKIVNYGIGLIK